jgi:type IV secretory pathway TraG/TraD family ATPase VirD4
MNRNALINTIKRVLNVTQGDRTIFWGDFDRPLPFEKARENNFLIMGAIGSGKTTMLLVVLHDIIPHIAAGSKQRAVIYDPKTEFLPHLVPLLPDGAERIRILHPRDRRGYAWDLAADIAGHEEAAGVAHTLIPERTSAGGGSERFFMEMSRGFVLYTLLGLRALLGTDWNFRDFANTLLTPDLRRRVLAVTSDGREMAAELGDERTEASIKADIRSRFEKFRRLGEFMDHHARAGRKLSLKGWVRTESVLVLGEDPEASSLLDDLNRTIMQRLQSILLDPKYNPRSTDGRPESTTTLILDEFAGFADKEALQRLLILGRSYGLCTMLAFQSRHPIISAFQGTAEVNTITSLLGNLMFLRLGDPEDAQWAAEMLGKKHVAHPVNVQRDEYGNTTISQQVGGVRQEDYIVPTPSLRDIQSGGPIEGFVRSPLRAKPFGFKIGSESLAEYRSCDKQFPAYDFFPDDWQPAAWDRSRIEAALAKHESSQTRVASSAEQTSDQPQESLLTLVRRFQASSR